MQSFWSRQAGPEAQMDALEIQRFDPGRSPISQRIAFAQRAEPVYVTTMAIWFHNAQTQPPSCVH